MGTPLSEADSSLEIDTRDPVARMKLSAAVSERRASLVKYVIAAVGLAGLLCIAAVVRAASVHADKAAPSPAWVSPTTAGAWTSDAPSPAPVGSADPSALVVPLDPKAAAKAAKEAGKERAKARATDRGKTGADRATNTSR